MNRYKTYSKKSYKKKSFSKPTFLTKKTYGKIEVTIPLIASFPGTNNGVYTMPLAWATTPAYPGPTYLDLFNYLPAGSPEYVRYVANYSLQKVTGITLKYVKNYNDSATNIGYQLTFLPELSVGLTLKGFTGTTASTNSLNRSNFENDTNMFVQPFQDNNGVSKHWSFIGEDLADKVQVVINKWHPTPNGTTGTNPGTPCIYVILGYLETPISNTVSGTPLTGTVQFASLVCTINMEFCNPIAVN